MKRVVSAVLIVLYVCLFVFLVVLSALVFVSRRNGTFLVGGYGIGTVVTGSMEPQIPADSMIVVRQTDASEIKVGDVLCFYSSDPADPHERPITHQVVEIAGTAEKPHYITKGTANETADVYAALPENIVGKVIACSAPLGKILVFAQQMWVGEIIVVVLFANLLMMIVLFGRLLKKSLDEKDAKK